MSLITFLVLLVALFHVTQQFNSFKSVSNTSNRNHPANARADKKPEPIAVSSGSKLNEDDRLQKIIARAGIASRRNAAKLILDGRVTLNGKMVTEVGTRVQMKTDIVAVDGNKIKLPDLKKTFWVVVNKPRNILATTSDEKDRETVMDLVPKSKELRLLPVGRLERDTTGVLLLTNENGWIHPLTHPSYLVKKRFEVVTQGIPTESQLESVGVDFTMKDGTIMKKCEIQIFEVDTTANLCILDVQFEHAQPLAVQRIMEHLNLPIISIKRTSFGPISLKGLKKGEWRELTSSEVTKLKDECVKAPMDEATQTLLSTNKRVMRRQRFSGNLFYSSTNRPGTGYFKRTIGRGLAQRESASTNEANRPKTLSYPSYTESQTNKDRSTDDGSKLIEYKRKYQTDQNSISSLDRSRTWTSGAGLSQTDTPNTRKLAAPRPQSTLKSKFGSPSRFSETRPDKSIQSQRTSREPRQQIRR